MPTDQPLVPTWMSEWFSARKITLWGVADLRGFSTPRAPDGVRFPFAISFAVPLDPQIMFEIQDGPNHPYATEYARVNIAINEFSNELASEIGRRGFRSAALAASERTDPVEIKGAFPHKTAATRAGLGWIGRNCQLVTKPYGPWIRLATVFTDMEVPFGPTIERDFCGRCTACVDACPAQALTGKPWVPGLARSEILDVEACDRWKKEHYFEFHQGHTCGICSAVCPFGLKVFKRT